MVSRLRARLSLISCLQMSQDAGPDWQQLSKVFINVSYYSVADFHVSDEPGQGPESVRGIGGHLCDGSVLKKRRAS